MPPHHQRVGEWTPQRLRTRAGEVGPGTVQLVEALLTLVRGARSSDTERTVISAALRVLSAQHLTARRSDPNAPAPLLADLLLKATGLASSGGAAKAPAAPNA